MQIRGETHLDQLEPVPMTKRALLVSSHAMERAFDDGSDEERDGTDAGSGLVIGFFQRREYFDVEAERYAALAAAGHVVIVAFEGSLDGLPAGVHAVSFAADDPRSDDWVVVLVRGSYAAALVARELGTLSTAEATLQAGRLFDSRLTVRRHLALSSARTQLVRLGGALPASVLTAALDLVEASAALAVSAVEDRLATAADHLITSVEAGHRQAIRLRVELESTKAVAERDQLTGLHNRHYLERYLGSGDRPADLLVMLVDVDGLKSVNDQHGHDAGDAVLVSVAETLRRNTRDGDVVVRWGGDEFLVLSPLMVSSAGLAYAERLADAVRNGSPAVPWQRLRPSASIGVGTTRRTPIPLDRLDAALFEVKRGKKGHAALAPV